VVSVASRPLALGALAAALALVASIVAAVGPAGGKQAEYRWPGEPPPALSPEEGWYAPLPLLNRVPASLEIRLPCDLAPPIRGDRSVLVLSTTRRTQRDGGLQIALSGGRVRARVGNSEVASAPWPASCPLGIDVERGEVRLLDRQARIRPETPGNMPIVTGLFTGLDLRAGAPPRVTLETRVYATSPSTWQVLAAGSALLLALGALVLLSMSDGLRERFRLRRRVARAWDAREPSDLVVVAVLVAWWIVAPTFFDDGWLWMQNRLLRDGGEVSLYYDNWGVSSPLGYWLVWLQHWVTGATDHLAVARLPTLLTLLATWPLCRWCVGMSVRGKLPRGARWTLVAAFLVGATAWGMTLRPEPFVGLLALVCLTAMVSFARAPRLTPLAIAVPAVVLALAAHPTGIVALAPILASARPLIGLVRASTHRVLAGLAALLLVGAALGLVLGTVDADLGSRLAAAQLIREGELHDEPFWKEYTRYTRFDQYGGSAMLRRLSLGLLLLSVAASLTRRRTVSSGVQLLPALSVAIGLLSLAFLPSKWSWHLGALSAIGAVAIAAEAARLIRERGSRFGGIRALVIPAVIALVGVWVWFASPGQWSPFDLQRLIWSRDLNILPWLIALVLFIGLAARRSRRRRRGASAASSGGLEWVLPVVSLAAVALTIAVLVGDAAISRWAPARQNVGAIAGSESCGLAHGLSGDARVVERIGDPTVRTLLVPELAMFFPCATTPGIGAGLVELPQLVISRGEPWPLEGLDAPFSAVADLYDLRTIAEGPHSSRVQIVVDEIDGFGKLVVRAERRG
jgi:hypothetical protein